MPWFKVDDGFYDHPKVLGLDVAAVGLWTLAGAYCARHLTDGVITDKQVRAIGGTRKQAEKLVASGLWSADDAPPSTRRYAFNDWRDFQPSRDETLSKREEARQRMADARAKKKQTSDNGEMFGRTNDERSQEVRQSDLRERSPYPDPTRPDPTPKEREVVGEVQVAREDAPAPSQDDRIDSALAAYAAERDAEQSAIPPGVGEVPPDWCTHDDPRCRTHANWERDQVPACRQCANAREWFEDQARAEVAQHRAEVQSCHWCDDRGLVNTHDTNGRPVAMQCDHKGPPPEIPADTGHQELTSAEKRRQLIESLNLGTKPGPF